MLGVCAGQRVCGASPQVILCGGIGRNTGTLPPQHQRGGIAGSMPFVIGHAGTKAHLNDKIRRTALEFRRHGHERSLLKHRVMQNPSGHKGMSLF